jgi:hypothetical protein
LSTASIQTEISPVAVNDQDLSEKYNLPLIPYDFDHRYKRSEEVPGYKYVLSVNSQSPDSRLELISLRPCQRELPFSIDFLSSDFQRRLSTIKSSPLKETVSKAVGMKSNLVVDMTPGLGRDAIILAASKAERRVLLIERNPVVYLLLADGFRRLFQQQPFWKEKITFLHGDSARSDLSFFKTWIDSNSNESVDSSQLVSVYLDPMFPIDPNARKSNVKKETQILHHIVTLPSHQPQCSANTITDDRALFETAFRIATDRIVVKRGFGSPPLSSDLTGKKIEPAYSLDSGKTQRFDVYLVQ